MKSQDRHSSRTKTGFEDNLRSHLRKDPGSTAMLNLRKLGFDCKFG
jgi:hypothetical protein